MLEMDVRLAADGVPVVTHDAIVDRTTNGSGSVRAFTSRQLRRLDAACTWSGPSEPGNRPFRGAGISIPGLEDVFKAFPGARMVIEVKEPGEDSAVAVGELVRRYGRMDRTIVASFHTALLRFFRARYPEIATSAGYGEVVRFRLLQKLSLSGLVRPGYVALQVPERWRGIPVVTPRLIRAARAKSLSVHVWTVNDPRDMHRLLDMGVEALITDDPVLALEITRLRVR
jgi:glycerophosphoryl diester phosphodiesterase